MADEIESVAGGINAMELNDDRLAKMKVVELKTELRRRNLRVTGKKAELLARLKAAVLLEKECDIPHEDETEEDEDEEDDEAAPDGISEKKRCGKTWPGLKRALRDEFEETVNSLQVHRELEQRKKKTDETYQEYMYKMLEIAAQADIETRAVIQYIIEGIVDDATHKVILYGAKTIKQLKEKFDQYECLKREAAKAKPKSVNQKSVFATFALHVHQQGT